MFLTLIFAVFVYHFWSKLTTYPVTSYPDATHFSLVIQTDSDVA